MPILTDHRHDERGFTLIELLVVILIIGILAAIALPIFLGQRSKAQDVNAKSDVRNLASLMESCDRNSDGYLGCTAQMTNATTGLSIGTGAGQVHVISESDTGYQIEAISKADSGGSNHSFKITRTSTGGSLSRTCTPAGQGGCPSDGTW